MKSCRPRAGFGTIRKLPPSPASIARDSAANGSRPTREVGEARVCERFIKFFGIWSAFCWSNAPELRYRALTRGNDSAVNCYELPGNHFTSGRGKEEAAADNVLWRQVRF